MSRVRNRWVWAGVVAGFALLASACSSGDSTRTVTAVDYRFENLPASVDSGTTLTLKNTSPRELHEMVFIRLPDSEKRSVDELAKLPMSQLQGIAAGPPAAVLLAGPNQGEVVKAVGDGKLTEKGRYLVICAIPTGADPNAYLQAAAASPGGPPQVAGGPPHLVNGMYGQVTVK